MLSFLNPIILIGLIAAAIPILLHLLTKSRAKTIDFSTLHFLKELQRQKIRKVKLRQLLLLILRTLIIVLLVLAFARPTARRAIYGGQRATAAQSSMAIVLDNSLSMAREAEGSRLFDRAVDRAEEIADLLTHGGEAFVLLAESPPRLAHRGAVHEADRLLQILRSQEISYSRTNISAAIEKARELLEQSDNINREIYLVSDLQTNAFSHREDSVAALNAELFILPVQQEVYDNLCIEKIEIVSKIIEKGKTVQLSAEVSNYGINPQRNRLVQLYIDGKRTAQSIVSLEPNESKEVQFSFTPTISGMLTGTVVVEDDGQRFDDERYFIVNVPHQISVYIHSNERDALRLKNALQPGQAEDAAFRIRNNTGTSLAGEILSNYELLILNNLVSLPERDVRALRNYIANGGGMLFAVGSDTDIRFFNTVISPQLELPRFVESIGQLGNRNVAFQLGAIDYSHPIFHGVFIEDGQRVRSPQFLFAQKVGGGGNYTLNILEYSSGDPFLYESTIEKGKILVLTSGLSGDWSTFSTSTLFAPLVNRCCRYLASGSDYRENDRTVGGVIEKHLGEVALVSQYEMRTPNGMRIALLPEELRYDFAVSFTETDVPGIYTLHADGEEVDRWAVNIDSEESKVISITRDELLHRYGSASIIEESDAVFDRVSASRLGREYWKLLIILVLIMLIVEMALYREKGEVTVTEPAELTT